MPFWKPGCDVAWGKHVLREHALMSRAFCDELHLQDDGVGHVDLLTRI